MSIGCSGKGMFNRLFFVQYLVIGLFFLGFSSQLMAAADITVKVYESGSSLKVEVSGSITKAGWGSPTKYSDEDSGGGYTEMYKSNGQHIFGWASSGLNSRWYYEPKFRLMMILISEP